MSREGGSFNKGTGAKQEASAETIPEKGEAIELSTIEHIVATLKRREADIDTSPYDADHGAIEPETNLGTDAGELRETLDILGVSSVIEIPSAE